MRKSLPLACLPVCLSHLSLVFSAVLAVQVWLFHSLGNAESRVDSKALNLNSLLGPSGSIAVIDLTNGKEIVSWNSEKTLMPASTMKIVTSVAALDRLGPNYTFKTRFYLRGNTLMVKGGADPQLTTERVYLIARSLKLLGLRDIRTLILDSSALKDPVVTSGIRAYEAGSSALAFNFNSLGLRICPGPTHGAKAVVQPLLWEDSIKFASDVTTSRLAGAEVAVNLAADNKVELSGRIENDSACITRYVSHPDGEKSFGNFLAEQLHNFSIGSDISVKSGEVPPGSKEVLEFESPPLSQILGGLNHFSTNSTAEQLVAVLGQDQSELSTARGLSAMKHLLDRLGFQDSKLDDGSGLRRGTRISSKAVATVLHYGWTRPTIRPFLESSLPILGVSGTLRKRSEPAGRYQVFAKSGTLDGVSSLAGYLYLENGGAYSFSILQNEVADLARAHDIEEKILESVALRLSK